MAVTDIQALLLQKHRNTLKTLFLGSRQEFRAVLEKTD